VGPRNGGEKCGGVVSCNQTQSDINMGVKVWAVLVISVDCVGGAGVPEIRWEVVGDRLDKRQRGGGVGIAYGDSVQRSRSGCVGG